MTTKVSFSHLFAVVFTLAAASLLGGCSDLIDSIKGDDSADDLSVYCTNNDDEAGSYWAYEASTARDLENSDAAANVNFSCKRLPHGYYRAMISTIDVNHHTQYSFFTLDPDFNVVAYVTPMSYFVVTRDGSDEYNLRDAREFKNDIPESIWPDDKKAPLPGSRTEVSYHKSVAQALIDFRLAGHPYSTIDFVDWAATLRRVAADDTKPAVSAPYQGNLTGPALLDYEIDQRIEEELADVRTVTTRGITPMLDGVETAEGKFIVHLSFGEQTWTTDGDFTDLRCGIVFYDRYGTNHMVRYWLEPKPIERYESTLTYDHIPPLDRYEARPYIIRADYVKAGSPLTMFTDMALQCDTYNVTVMPDNAITVSSVSEGLVTDPNSTDVKYIHVKGHARCDINPEEGDQWFVAYAFLDDYMLGNLRGPSCFSINSINTHYEPFRTPETDFDILIPIDEGQMILDPTTGQIRANLVIFLSNGDEGFGHHTVVRWSAKTVGQ